MDGRFDDVAVEADRADRCLAGWGGALEDVLLEAVPLESGDCCGCSVLDSLWMRSDISDRRCQESRKGGDLTYCGVDAAA